MADLRSRGSASRGVGWGEGVGWGVEVGWLLGRSSERGAGVCFGCDGGAMVFRSRESDGRGADGAGLGLDSGCADCDGEPERLEGVPIGGNNLRSRCAGGFAAGLGPIRIGGMGRFSSFES
ncbi:MAG: hypothetical protein ACOYN0_11340 [Phycisphaerales bacterium]